MRRIVGLLACLAMGAVAQEIDRPQLSSQAAASYTVSTYLSQGPSSWTPADLAALPVTKPDILVATDGSGTHRTLQEAFDSLPSVSDRRWVIGIAPGVYRDQVCLQAKAPVAIMGTGLKPWDVQIVASRYAGESKRSGIDQGNPCLPEISASSYGTFSSATFAVFSNDVQLRNLTIENDAMQGVRQGVGYPAGAGESGGAQAVALMTQGDRIQLEDVRLMGHQDTLYVRAAPEGLGDRVYVHKSLIAGDVDFIFGNGTLVVDNSTILSRAGRRVPGNGGHILAPSTAPSTRWGFLVYRSRLISEDGLRPGSISLGRAWDQGVGKGAWQKSVSPNGQALVRDSVIGSHVGPWAISTSRRPFTASGDQANRMWEWNNHNVTLGTGPSAGAHWSREVLSTRDGWAAAAGGTVGGAGALPEHTYTVHTRADLIAALRPADYPRIVLVKGTIDLSTDASGRSLGIADYSDPAFDQKAFLRAYDPAVWGKKPPSGILEEARQRSAKRQSQQVVVKVPSDTTLVGIGADAAIVNGSLVLDQVDNVILRNIHFSDAYDYFPAWDPKDNAHGEWNSEYDNVTLRGATHVWIDHCTFDDGSRPDSGAPVYFGRQVQHHDGMLDITRQSNWVTVSWNYFRDHDKTTLVGNSDTQTQDEGKLKVTFHHNLYENVKERTPRVRFGQVHVYNNVFVVSDNTPNRYGYSIGVGYASRIYSQNNAWITPDNVPSTRIVRALKGDHFIDKGSVHNGQDARLMEHLREAYPAVQWSEDPGWVPQLALTVDAASTIPAIVRQRAGSAKYDY